MSRIAITDVSIAQGYTGHDHLITWSDTQRIVRAVLGRSYEDRDAAEQAAYAAFVSGCDRRVWSAKIVLATTTVPGGQAEIAAVKDVQRELARYVRA